MSAALNWNADVGPKYPPILSYGKLQDFVDSIRDRREHLYYSDQLEQKEIWFRYLGGGDVFTHMGRELYAGPDALSEEQSDKLCNELVWALKQKRFFSKAPTNSFRLCYLESISTKPKFVAIVRDGKDVVASWGRRPYGFRRVVNWGEVKTLWFRERKAIEIFARKWLETIEAIQDAKDRGVEVLVVNYDSLLANWAEVVTRIFSHCELECTKEVRALEFKNEPSKWVNQIHRKHHALLKSLTEAGNAWIQKNSI